MKGFVLKHHFLKRFFLEHHRLDGVFVVLRSFGNVITSMDDSWQVFFVSLVLVFYNQHLILLILVRVVVFLPKHRCACH